MSTYDIVIIGTLFGFIFLAYLLLAPVNRFLDRETEISKKWTKEALARRARKEKSGSNGQHNKKEDNSRDRNPPAEN